MRTFSISILAILAVACATSVDDVDSWGIQLQGLDGRSVPDRLAEADLDLVVIDRPNSCRGHELYPTFALVSGIRESGKLCIAYVNVGQAEEYRTYWQKTWTTPGADRPGNPSFLLAPDRDGWSGNHSVAFWDPDWQIVLDDLLAGAVRDGFDGVMLDWVAAWDDPKTAALARQAGIDPAEAMGDLIRHLAERGRGRRDGFLVLLNDAADLLEEMPELAEVVDGVVQESVSFYGAPSEDWDDPKNADVPVPARGAWSTETTVRRLAALRERGVAVFTLDYASRPENQEAARALAHENGFVPAVSRTPLDRLPE